MKINKWRPPRAPSAPGAMHDAFARSARVPRGAQRANRAGKRAERNRRSGRTVGPDAPPPKNRTRLVPAPVQTGRASSGGAGGGGTFNMSNPASASRRPAVSLPCLPCPAARRAFAILASSSSLRSALVCSSSFLTCEPGAGLGSGRRAAAVSSRPGPRNPPRRACPPTRRRHYPPPLLPTVAPTHVPTVHSLS